MNRYICKILANELVEDNYFANNISGLVQTIEQNRNKFPVSVCGTASGCASSNDLVPNSSALGIIYFEETRGAAKINENLWRSSVRLVCWLNSNKIGINCGEIHPVVFCIKKLTNGPFNSNNIKNIVVSIKEEVVRSAGIFSRYTYKEDHSQYLMPPFDFFAIDLEVSFYLPIDCLTKPELNPVKC